MGGMYGRYWHSYKPRRKPCVKNRFWNPHIDLVPEQADDTWDVGFLVSRSLSACLRGGFT
ncbi:hypothetical protein K470DRAFT_255174 [Piedraia hortae CBS 480.64]|uniref:Uncharacterized protein n=1 Tax=Piedraia hortae CBS 480.64 TaxID=1314780 RepID=A0A6A7CA32_9PEZI|nr:hypothetical protein K470DRAFT_255174 [Piedraia hortae CBS 480.64]